MTIVEALMFLFDADFAAAWFADHSPAKTLVHRADFLGSGRLRL